MSDTRNLGRVLDLLADILQHGGPTTRGIRHVEVVRTDRGMAAALILTFLDGDRWTVAAAPHRTPGEDEDLAKLRAVRTCEGHTGEDADLLAGTSTGETTYCDGSCKR